jgi:hypothetical protein
MPLAPRYSRGQSLAVRGFRAIAARKCGFPGVPASAAAIGALSLGGLLASFVLVSCGEDSQPDPPDMAGSGGESGDGPCPSDLPGRDICATSTPSYRLEAALIIEQRCATCHYPDNTQSRYVFTDHDDVYADRQTVLTRIYGCVMPPDGAPQLTPDERRVLLAWFVCGAPDN